MVKVNRVVILFLFIVSLLLGGVWSIIQSEAFSKLLSEQITKTIQKKSKMEISFNNLEVKLFPPATIINEVSLKQDKDLLLEAGSVGLYFGLLDFFSDELTISKVVANDSKSYLPKLKDFKSDNKKSKILISDVFSDIKTNAKEKLPIEIKSLILNRSIVFFSDDYISVANVEMNSYETLYDLSLKINEVEIKDYAKYIDLFDLDSIDGRIQLTEKKVWIKELNAQRKLDKFSISGELENTKKDLLAKLDLNAEVELKNYIHLFGIDEELKGLRGFSELDASITMEGEDVSASINADIYDFYSQYFYSDNIKTSLDYRNEKIVVNKLSIKEGKSSAKLREPVLAYDLKEKKFSNDLVKLNLKGIHTNQALYAINDTMETFKGNLTGNVDVSWTGKEVVFDIHNESSLTNFVLESTPGSSPILINKKVKLNKSEIKILEDYSVTLDMDLEIEKSKLRAKGLIDENGIKFISERGYLDLKELGPISGTQLYGAGNLTFDFHGPYEDVRFQFDADFKNFEILEFKLGEVQTQFELELNKTILHIQSGKGLYKDSSYEVIGNVDFEKENIALDVNFLTSTLDNSWEMFTPITKNIDWKLDDVRATLKQKFKVRGPFDENKIQVFGNVEVEDIRLLEEDIDKIDLNFNYENSVLSLSNITARKGSGIARGKMNFNILSGYFEYESNLANLKLDDLTFYRIGNFGLDGVIKADFYGNGTVEDFSTRAHIKLENSLIGSQSVQNSFVTIFNNSTDVYASGSFLGEQGKVNAYLNLNERSSQKSHLKARLKSTKIKELFGVISSHNIRDESLFGKLDIDLNSVFDINKWQKSDVTLTINDLVAVKDQLYIEVDKTHNKVEITNGKINRWDVRFKGGDDFITFNGTGDLSDEYKLEQQFQVDAKTAEILSDKIAKASGKVKGRGVINGFKSQVTSYMEVLGTDLFTKVEVIPNPFTNISFKVIWEGRELFLETLNADYGQGKISAAGNILFQIPFPKVNLTSRVDNSYISFLDKSGVLINSDLRISGDKIPYSLSGHVAVIGGAVEDQIENFSKAQKSSRDYERYIPKKEFEGRIDYLNFNVDLDFLQPVLFKNRLADIQFNGTGKITGTLEKPRVSGNLSIIPGVSKFLFKGHEFLLSEGQVNFQGSESINPGLDFIGSTQVNEYGIKLVINGNTDELGIDLSSEPALSKQDILSLLTLGYTADISKNLEDKERESVTTIGLGTLIVDQLRLNEGLNSSLGLKLSVLPEFSENESSLLQGKTSGSEKTSKLKSGTKVKLQKKLSKKVDLSVSSTVGGSLDQKQEMNLNYNVNKSISFEGVYEVKSTDEESNETPESVGADIKFKWTF